MGRTTLKGFGELGKLLSFDDIFGYGEQYDGRPSFLGLEAQSAPPLSD